MPRADNVVLGEIWNFFRFVSELLIHQLPRGLYA